MNTRREIVGYQPFRGRPLLSEGLLGVERDDGELERRVAAGMFHLAGYFGEKADAAANRQGHLDGLKAAQEGRTLSSVSAPDYGIDPQLTRSIAPERGGVAGIISKVASEEGVPGEHLLAFAQIESGLNPNAKNPTSSAEGLFQQLDANARQYGVANKRDPVQSTRGAAKFYKENRAYLSKVLGRDPSAGELYLAHQQGPGGAAKLLSNPNARAMDIVGRDAVRLNGGDASMTAGEFARKWTSKVKPLPPGKMIKDRPVASVSDPAPQPAPGGDVTLTGGTFRPTNRDTVYGRAYDKAGVSAYLNFLEAEITSTTGQMFRKYRDDPEALAGGFEALRKDFLKQHVLPEIGADFELAFVRRTGSYLEQAYEEQDRKAKENALADFNTRTTGLENEQAQAIEGFNPQSAGTAELLASQQAAIDRHYDEAVDKGILTAPAAQAAKEKSGREAALGFYTKQAESLDADGVKAMREAMSADFADGGIEGLDAASWGALNDRLSAAERGKRIEANQAEVSLTKQGEALAARAAAGFDVNKDELAQFTLDGAAFPDLVAEAQAKIGFARTVRDLPFAEAQKRYEALRKEAGDAPGIGKLRELAFAEEVLNERAKALKTDPLTLGESLRLTPPSGNLGEIAAQSPDGVAETLQQRLAAADGLSAHLGAPVGLLKPGEAKALADIAKADPARGAEIAGAIVEGAGPRAMEVLSEFGDTAPIMAGAGMILANGGSPQAAEDALAGQSSEIKIKPKSALASTGFRETAGDALNGQPADAARIRAVALSITRRRLDESGIDPDGEDAADVYEQALHEAAGGSFEKGAQFGGFVDFGKGVFSSGVKVLVPPGIRADMFDEVIAAFTDADIALKPRGGMASLTGLTPVAVDGGYLFTDGEAYAANEFGDPFKLDVEAYRKVIGPRVPGAFK